MKDSNAEPDKRTGEVADAEFACFVCGTTSTPKERRHARTGKDRCPKCGWGGGGATDAEDPKYLVLWSLINRALKDGEMKSGTGGGGNGSGFIRITPSPREYALLEHGDQMRVDDLLWRITVKNDGILYLRCARVEKFVTQEDGDSEHFYLRSPFGADTEEE